MIREFFDARKPQSGSAYDLFNRQLGAKCYFTPFLRQCVITLVLSAIFCFSEASQVFFTFFMECISVEVHPVHKRS